MNVLAQSVNDGWWFYSGSLPLFLNIAILNSLDIEINKKFVNTPCSLTMMLGCDNWIKFCQQATMWNAQQLGINIHIKCNFLSTPSHSKKHARVKGAMWWAHNTIMSYHTCLYDIMMMGSHIVSTFPGEVKRIWFGESPQKWSNSHCWNLYEFLSTSL